MKAIGLPRGIRNFNPGNIEWGDKWQGLVPKGPTTDTRFAVFTKPTWGIRALARTLITYYDKYGINTVQGAINRWAPPVENDTGSYVNQVARAVGVPANAPIDFQDYHILRPMVEAIIRHENGDPAKYGQKAHNNINQWYDDDTITEALKLAGVVESKPVLATKEGKAVGAAAATGGIAAAVEIGNQLMPMMGEVRRTAQETDGMPDWLRVTIMVLTIISACAAAYVLYKKHKSNKSV